MKFKVVYRKKTGIKRFRIESDKNDELGYAEAETLKRGGLSSLVPLTYEQRGRIYRFTYAAQGFVPLSKMTGEPFAPRQLERMLTSFYTLLLECENNGLMRQRVCADPEYILYNEAARECRFSRSPRWKTTSRGRSSICATARRCRRPRLLCASAFWITCGARRSLRA